MNFSSDRQLLKALSSVLHFIKTAARLLHSAGTRGAHEHGPCHRAGGRAVVMPEPLSPSAFLRGVWWRELKE